MKTNFDIVVVGGGTGGIMAAAQIRRKIPNASIGLVEPSDTHWYQPAWTLVAADTYNYNKTKKPMKDLIPKGVTWIKDYVTKLNPNDSSLFLRNGEEVSYKFLVLSPGLVYRFEMIEGLAETINKNGVCSNYTDPLYTREVLKSFKGGTALFTQPSTPIKCGGAPQKIMYLADEFFRKSGVRDKTEIVFATPGSVIFGVKVFADTLNKIIQRKNIHTRYYYSLYKIDAEKKEAYFRYTHPSENQCTINNSESFTEKLVGQTDIVIQYDMLHLAPPQSAPDFIRDSELSVQEGAGKGWLDVDIHTLQHKTYPNVFGIGDVANLPTAKTGAAIRKQVPVVVENIKRLLQKEPISDLSYEGYSSCPLVTGYGKMLLAEFKYNNVRDSDKLLSKFFNLTHELWSMWILKKYVLPWMYWNRMLKGKM
jgi:sulfide:quinone oxidoreductase